MFVTRAAASAFTNAPTCGADKATAAGRPPLRPPVSSTLHRLLHVPVILRIIPKEQGLHFGRILAQLIPSRRLRPRRRLAVAVRAAVKVDAHAVRAALSHNGRRPRPKARGAAAILTAKALVVLFSAGGGRLAGGNGGRRLEARLVAEELGRGRLLGAATGPPPRRPPQRPRRSRRVPRAPLTAVRCEQGHVIAVKEVSGGGLLHTPDIRIVRSGKGECAARRAARETPREGPRLVRAIEVRPAGGDGDKVIVAAHVQTRVRATAGHKAPRPGGYHGR